MAGSKPPATRGGRGLSTRTGIVALGVVAMTGASLAAPKAPTPPPLDASGRGERTSWQSAADRAWTLGTPALAQPVGVVQPAPSQRPAPSGPPLSPSAPHVPASTRAPAASWIPPRVLQAYQGAESRLAVEQPGCRLAWSLLAGIGRVESGHGTFLGAAVGGDGRVLPPIIGIQLDGTGPVAEIRDTDGGRLDRDRVFDRAVGPMQFLPGTWLRGGADGDGNGVADPHDIDDAALAAGRYLCAAAGGPLTDRAAAVRAVYAYNNSHDYVRLVLTLAAGYAGQPDRSLGADLIPPQPLPGPPPAVPGPPPGTAGPGRPAGPPDGSAAPAPIQGQDSQAATQPAEPMPAPAPEAAPAPEDAQQPDAQPSPDAPAEQPTEQPTQQPGTEPTSPAAEQQPGAEPSPTG